MNESGPLPRLGDVSHARQRTGWERLGEVQVPKGIIWIMLVAGFVRRRKTDQAVAEFSNATAEFGTFVGTRIHEGDKRDQRLLDLQSSVERLTRWLVTLTIALGVIGLASIGATIWAAVR